MVTAVFGGVLHNEVNCLICGTESKKFDPFLGEICLQNFPSVVVKMLLVSNIFSPLDLSLDIPSQFRVKKTKDQEPGPVCTLGGKLPHCVILFMALIFFLCVLSQS